MPNIQSDYKMKVDDIKGKPYISVHERIKFLDKSGTDYSILNIPTYYPEQQMWVVRSELTIGSNVYVANAQEIEGSSHINKTSALENCETSAVGRAFGMAGIGIDHGIASTDEIKKAKGRGKKIQEPKKKEEKSQFFKITDTIKEAMKKKIEGGKSADEIIKSILDSGLQLSDGDKKVIKSLDVA